MMVFVYIGEHGPSMLIKGNKAMERYVGFPRNFV